MMKAHPVLRLIAAAVLFWPHQQMLKIVAGFELVYVVSKNNRQFIDQINANTFEPDEVHHSGCYPPHNIAITRHTTGSYSVHVGHNITGIDSNLQVTSQGPAGDLGFCNLVHWKDGDVHIRCRNATGAPLDRPFAVQVIKAPPAEPQEEGAEKLAFAWIHDSSEENSSLPLDHPSWPPAYSYGLVEDVVHGNPVRVGIGQYQVKVGGKLNPTKNAAVFVSVDDEGGSSDTPVPPGYCNIHSWLQGGTEEDELLLNSSSNEDDVSEGVLNIACYDPYGFPIDSSVSLLIVSRHMEGVNFVWNLDQNTEGGNSAFGEVVRIESGRYAVKLGLDFSYWNDFAQVSAYGSDARCFATGWVDYSSRSIEVNCYDLQGNSVDSEFIVASLNGAQAVASKKSSSRCHHVDSPTTTVPDRTRQDAKKDRQRDIRSIPVGFAVPALIMGIIFCCFKAGSARVGSSQRRAENGDPLRDNHQPHNRGLRNDIKTTLANTTMTVKTADLVMEETNIEHAQELDIEVSSSSSSSDEEREEEASDQTIMVGRDLESSQCDPRDLYSASQRSANLGYNMLRIPGQPKEINSASKKARSIATIEEADKKVRGESRLVPSMCAICLSSYRVQEQVCWSQNSQCPHAFHLKCLERMARYALNNAVGDSGRCLHCPLCRQNFTSEDDCS